MKQLIKTTTSVLFVFVFSCLPFMNLAQTPTDNHHLHKSSDGGNIDAFYLPYDYDADSLIGFDEAAAWQQAEMNSPELWAQQRLVAVLKRNFIDFKYGFKTVPTNPTVQAPCTNADFETGTLTGWTATQGPNNNSLTMAGCCPNPTSQAVIVGPGNDPNVGAAVPMVPPGGGNFACRLGQTTTGGMSYRLSQTFTVTAANSVFIYKYAVILQDGTHSCSEQPFFNIRFETCNNVAIPCGQYQVSAYGSGCSSGDPSFVTSGAWRYKTWQTRSFDLSAYIGQCVTIEFTVGGCVASQGAHPGYVYIDCSCQPMTLNLNGTDIPVGQTTTNMCASVTNTLCAPPGFTSYSWTGPGVTGQTNQCITTSTSGTYSVTLGMAGSSCNSPVLYSNFNIVPKPIADFTFTTTACQSTFSVPFTDGSSVNGGPALTNWYWDFDGNGSVENTNQSPTNTYTAPGTYSVELKVSNGGCTDSITKTVIVSPNIAASFTSASGCIGTATNFTATSTPTTGIIGHTWNFGDGSPNGSGTNVSHTYTTSGTKIVSYTVTNSGGCSSTFTQAVTVNPSPVMAITGTSVCLNQSTTFGNTSSIAAPDNISNWAWDFNNDGVVDNTTQTPTNTYAAAGTYTVELKATSNNGCSDSTTIQVKVNPLPTATFTPVNACVNYNVALNNTSSIAAPDNIQSYSWNFGAGANPATGNTANISPLVYTSAGVKNITLNLMSNNSCTATITQTVDIFPAPTANFSVSAVCQGSATAYTDLSTPTGSVTSWEWDFTSNNSIDNNTQNPNNTFASSGTFTSSLIVTSSNGCKDTVSMPVNVWGHAIPDFTPDKVCFGTASQFTNLTNETTNPNTGTGATYAWNFADGGTSAATNPVHTYTLGGNANANYNVTLVVTSFHGCVDSVSKTVSVYAIPTASFTADSVCLGTPSQLTDASNGNGNTINTYQWDFLSDGSVDATGTSNPNHTFPAYGANAVSYTVSTSPATGLVCANSISTITVWVNPNPTPDFTFVNNCINAQPNTFNASSSAIAIGTNTNYAWNYGDGGSSMTNAGSTSSHTYAVAGVYNVTLTVTSNKGCVKNIVKSVEVFEKPKTAITNSAPCDQVAMTFTAVTQPTSGAINNWYWDFNNSVTSVEGNGQNTSFTFSGPGAQTIHLISETDKGCRDTLTKVVYVNYVPQPQFTLDIPAGCPIHCVNFTDLTPAVTGPAQINQWTWNFGEGGPVTNSTNASVSHCYNNTSSSQLAYYNVQLTVTTDSGCTNTIIKNNYVTVYPVPVAAYVANPNPGSVTEPLIYFTNQSQNYTKWWWSFGDGPFKTDSVNVDPTHYYGSEVAQTYYSNLIVQNQYGCLDTAYLPIEIKPDFAFYIPNAFTPDNNDGINDYFNGKGYGIATYEMWIFDRWGEKVFYTDDLAKGWDGSVKGNSRTKQEVYVWKVKLTDVLGKKHEYIGHVTLVK